MPKAHRGSRHKSRKSNRQAARARSSGPAIADGILQPWFLNKPVARAILQLIPREYISRWRWYFEDYGCLRCRKKKALYCASGFCAGCNRDVRRRLVLSMKRRAKTFPGANSPEPKKWYFDRARAAEKLLGEFSQKRDFLYFRAPRSKPAWRALRSRLTTEPG